MWDWRPSTEEQTVEGVGVVECSHGSINQPHLLAWSVYVRADCRGVMTARWWRKRRAGVSFRLTYYPEGVGTAEALRMGEDLGQYLPRRRR